MVQNEKESGMIESFLKIVDPNSESAFVYYIIPSTAAVVSIIFIWLVFLAIAKLLKLKGEKWQEPKYNSSFARRFIATQKSLIRKTLIALRYAFSVFILLNLTSHICEIFSSQLKDYYTHSTPKPDKIWDSIAAYAHTASKFIDKFSIVFMNIFFTILVAVWCLRILQKTINLFLNKTSKSEVDNNNARSLAKKNTLNAITNYILKILISIITIFTVLENLGINIAALLATAGLASVAIGFGAQSLVRDFIAGFFILFEDQFTIGDSVDIITASGVFSGSVERMTLRMVRVRSNEGSLLTIQNGDIRSVKNFTSDWARIDFKYSLDIKSNIEKALCIFQEEIERLGNDFSSEIIGSPDIRPLEKIADFEGRSVAVTFRFFQKTINGASKLKLETEFNRRLLTRFKSEEIIIK